MSVDFFDIIEVKILQIRALDKDPFEGFDMVTSVGKCEIL